MKSALGVDMVGKDFEMSCHATLAGRDDIDIVQEERVDRALWFHDLVPVVANMLEL